MSTPEEINCRIAGHRIRASRWDFYLINDSDAPLQNVRLDEVIFTWGSGGSTESGRFRSEQFDAGAVEKIWSEGGDGLELNMDFVVFATVGQRDVRLRFEFPKLYRLRNLDDVPGLGKPGIDVTPDVYDA